MLLQELTPPTPDTSAYYHAAYLAAAVLYGGYALSLWLRARRVRERLRLGTRERTEAPR